MFIRLSRVSFYCHFASNNNRMKHLFLLLLCSAACLLLRAQVTNPGQVAQQDASSHANNDVNSSINNSLSKTENTIKGLFKKKSKTAKPDSTAASSASTAAQGTAAAGAASSGPATLKTYSNYDFVPGEQVVFEDNFTDDQDGEFPAHWRLNKGQAISQ
jgi:OOP family OmpA-OmpF porin